MKAAIASLVTASVLAAIALVAPAAEAQARKPTSTTSTPTHQLPVELRNAQIKLRRAVAQRNKLRRELASSRAKVKQLKARSSRLKGTLTHTTEQRNAALEQASALQAQLAAIPKPLAVAVAQVQREVAYVQGGVSYSQGQLVSEAALDYVTGHVSDTAYGYLEVFGGALPSQDPDSALGAQAGFCVHAAVAFEAIVKQFGLQVRTVQFFYDDPGSPPAPDTHVAVETFYDGGWHFFDSTFGQFWTDASGHVLSISDVRAGLGSLQKDLASFTNVFEDAVFGDDTWFETDPATRVVIGTPS